jgi:hypothetical protein
VALLDIQIQRNSNLKICRTGYSSSIGNQRSSVGNQSIPQGTGGEVTASPPEVTARVTDFSLIDPYPRKIADAAIGRWRSPKAASPKAASLPFSIRAK